MISNFNTIFQKYFTLTFINIILCVYCSSVDNIKDIISIFRIILILYFIHVNLIEYYPKKILFYKKI